MVAITLSKRFAVYTDWTLEETPRVFYVGKGNQCRVNSYDRNEIHDRISAKYGCQRRVIIETDDEEEAFKNEIALISELKTYAHGGDDCWGANLTLGGDGTSGYVWSEENRAAQSERLKGRKFPDDFSKNVSDAQKLLWQDPKHREKMHTARAGKKKSDAHKQHLSELAKERWSDPQIREKYTTGCRARWTDEERKKHSNAAKQRWKDPDKRAQASISAKQRWSDPEQRAAKVDATKRLWDDPKYRAKLCRKRRCRHCGKLGHMAKTCQNHDLLASDSTECTIRR